MRHVANAEVARVKRRGISSIVGVKRSGNGKGETTAEVCTERSGGKLGRPLDVRGGGSLISSCAYVRTQIYRGGVARRNVPQRQVAEDAYAAIDREDTSSPSQLVFSGISVGDDRTAVILQHLRLSTVASDVLGFEGNLGLETNSKTRAISEVDLQFGSIAAIFEEIAEANDLPGEFFAFHHGDSLQLGSDTNRSRFQRISHLSCVDS